MVKGEVEVSVPAQHAFEYLLNEKKRIEWDGMVM